MSESQAIIFDVDPVLFSAGPFELRWYGLIFGVMIWLGFFLFYRQTRRGGYSIELVKRYLPWLLLSMIVGARLGHCLFYEPDKFLAEPLRMLKVWEGGLSSHGATVGILGGMYLFCRYHGIRYADLVDRITFSTAVAAALVRLGNLMNSEIVGARTDLPWGFKFVRHDCKELDLCQLFKDEGYLSDPQWGELVEATPVRHPTQIYELLIGAVVLATLFVLDRRLGRDRRPVGLLTGAFAITYFGARFLVEFVKERQILGEEVLLTMGQYMSIPAFLIGVALVIRAMRRPEPADEQPIPAKFSSRS
jgi:prolipoprotein diacylglyceryl transferase